MSVVTHKISGEENMVLFGEKLGTVFSGKLLVFLQGDLGVGKTTLTRGILRALGHHGAVKSPTYTLVEPYRLGDKKLYHFDLYRLADPEELEFMGIRDYLSEESHCLVEWPERGEGILPLADLQLQIEVAGWSRVITINANTDKGDKVLAALADE